jgi:enoyl-CoA hydratase/carnithine racemase
MTPADLPVLVERSGSRCDVVLNRPFRRNAVTLELVDGLTRALRAAEEDHSVKAVVLRGTGGCFCSGLDIKDVGSFAEFSAAWAALHGFMDSMRTPVVGALERAAVNAGAALAFACDLVVAGENAFLQVKEAAMGMTPPVNVAWLVTRYPVSLARRLTLTCDALAGPELLSAGIAARCVPDADVVPIAQALADGIAAYPDDAGMRVKAMVGSAAQGAVGGFAEALAATRRDL